MGFVQYFVAALLLSEQVLSSPVADMSECIQCPAGEYQKSCAVCAPCPAGSYTDLDLNNEEECHQCYGDCKSEFHLKVVQNCTSKSNLKCACEDGYRCTELVPLSENCRECVKIQDKTTTVAAADTAATTAVTSTTDKQRPPTASPGHSSTSPKPCRFPKCSTQSVPTADNGTHAKTEKASSLIGAILCPVVVMACVALVVLFCVRRPGDEACFRQTVAKLCKKEGQDVSQKSQESTHQFPRDSFSAKQSPSSPPSANLGPVHVHNPGTVIFSLLSQFTGQVGLTTEGGKTTERMTSEEEDERNCPVFHPTSPHSIHLSEEERSREIDSIFFPSQEQGKDCHVSKEEVL